MWPIEDIVRKGDYLYARVPDHPNATETGYVLLHRVVMENELNRLLTEDEIVHHENEIKFDCDPTNLRVMSLTEHSRLHGLNQGRNSVKLKCPCCGRLFERRRNQTHIVKSGFYTSCSRGCSGRFGRKLQIEGLTSEVAKAIAENIVLEYHTKTGS